MRILLFLLTTCGALGAPADAPPVVLQWNQEFLEAVRRQSHPPCLVARNLAILHLAVWKVVQAAPDDLDASIAAASHRVSTTLFAGDRSGFDRLFKSTSRVSVESVQTGYRIADEVLASRGDDGSMTTVHYEPGLGIGVWRRTTNNRPPELPHWAKVKTFVLARADQFRPPPPPALDSKEYFAAVEEVRKVGAKNSISRSEEQTRIARFWSDFSYSSSPPGRWNEIACSHLADKTSSEQARVLLLLNLSLADAAIAAWDCKYHHRFWRPQSALRSAGSPASQWDSLLPAPSHPEYVSGHSCFSGAAAHVLQETIGPQPEKIQVADPNRPGSVREFPSFSDAAKEVGRSRVYGGIHYSFSDLQGQELGRRVAAFVLKQHPDEPDSKVGG